MSRIPPDKLAEIAGGDFKLPSVRTYIAGFLAGLMGMPDQVGEVLNALNACARSMSEEGVLAKAAVIEAAIREPSGEYVMRVFTERLGSQVSQAPILEIVTGRSRSMFLKSYDPDARDGKGLIVFTDELAEARRFDTWKAVAECWAQTSSVQPTGPDGKPNCPLSAYSIQPERIDDDV